ncbi:hypothetical protein Q5P01_015736 [Channa striata]|uniref:Uncharacterized protein n=1 Tax=Channa striata TaxID=64152 RepID=A0AA88MFA3_CHASR|nr:hypothetical protein Q5P01_015736 [Channa striata]
MATHPTENWSTGLFDCFGDIRTFCYGFWCGPCLACTVSETFGEHRCLPLCDLLSPAITSSLGIPLCVPPVVLSIRVAMRQRYSIKAINLASDDAFILNLLAKVFFLMGKHEMATGICNMALNVLPDPELNWQAYCTRAKINMMLYIRDLEKAKQDQGSIPDRQQLTEARKDLDKMYYYMGVDAVRESIMVDEDAVNNALVSLSQALQFEMGDTILQDVLTRAQRLLPPAEG